MFVLPTTLHRAAAIRPIRRPLLLLALSAWPSLAAAQIYEMAVVDPSPGNGTTVLLRGINDSGEVVGAVISTTASWQFHWKSGISTRLAGLAGGTGLAHVHDINNRGYMVGSSETATSQHAVIWPGLLPPTDLEDLPGGLDQSRASAINNQDAVAAVGHIASRNVGFVWEKGAKTPITDPPGSQILPQDINSGGTVVAEVSIQGKWRGMLWRNGQVIILPDLPGGDVSCEAVAINDNDEVVGRSSGVDGVRPVHWSNGIITELPMLAGRVYGGARDLNNKGQIVGFSYLGTNSIRGVIWESGAIRDLNSLIDPRDRNRRNYEVRDALRINENGWIIATARHYRTGRHVGVILKPAANRP